MRQSELRISSTKKEKKEKKEVVDIIAKTRQIGEMICMWDVTSDALVLSF
jgi:hypothetical protein